MCQRQLHWRLPLSEELKWRACESRTWGRNKRSATSVSSSRYPGCAKRDARVALVIRNDAMNRYVFEKRTDLVVSPHVQCLDICETVDRRKARRIRLINVYNKAEVQGGDTRSTTSTAHHSSRAEPSFSDFARSPAWDPLVAGRQNPGTTERLIERHDLIVNKNGYQDIS